MTSADITALRDFIADELGKVHVELRAFGEDLRGTNSSGPPKMRRRRISGRGTGPKERVTLSPSEYQELAEFVATQFEKQRVEFMGRFGQIDARFDRLEERLTRVEASLEQNRDLIRLNAEAILTNGQAIAANAAAIRRTEEAILRLDGTVAGLSVKVSTLERDLAGFREEVGERLSRLEAA